MLVQPQSVAACERSGAPGGFAQQSEGGCFGGPGGCSSLRHWPGAVGRLCYFWRAIGRQRLGPPCHCPKMGRLLFHDMPSGAMWLHFRRFWGRAFVLLSARRPRWKCQSWSCRSWPMSPRRRLILGTPPSLVTLDVGVWGNVSPAAVQASLVVYHTLRRFVTSLPCTERPDLMRVCRGMREGVSVCVRVCVSCSRAGWRGERPCAIFLVVLGVSRKKN